MRKLTEAIAIAIANLRANTGRSILSILGIVIGIGSVITILAITAGARKDIIDRVNTLGVNVYMVFPKYDKKNYRVAPIEQIDIDALQRLPFVLTAYPRLNMHREIRTRFGVKQSQVRGVNSFYAKARSLNISKGRNFSPIEVESRNTVALINNDFAEDVFGESEALGQTIYFHESPWSVVGVYDRPKSKTTTRKPKRKRMEILVPLTTLLRTEEKSNISGIEIHVRPEFKGDAIREITSVMEKDDPKRKDMYRVWDQQDYLEQKLEIDKLLSMVVTLVASISLIVGGIGMMNVMLTSVAERTREIGLRRAVGAKKLDILFQFLVESSVLSVVGGLGGLIIGATCSKLAPVFFFEMIQAAPQIKPLFLLIAVGASILLGLAFGLYPAIKASKLSPADALRSE